MSKITDKNSQLVRWLSKLFPPSSPRYTQPEEIDEVLKLVVEALPPSVLFERLGFFSGATVNPATQLFSPSVLNADGTVDYTPGASGAVGVPLGKFLWVFAARMGVATAAPTAAGRAFIAIKPVGSVLELGVGTGYFPLGNLLTFADTHCFNLPGEAASQALQGGGCGPFIVPPGYHLHFSTSSVPAATTTYNGILCAVECTIGEQIPGSV